MSLSLRTPCDEALARSAPAAAPCTPADEPWILAATILASSLVFIDGMVVNVALARLQSAFDATLVQARPDQNVCAYAQRPGVLVCARIRMGQTPSA